MNKYLIVFVISIAAINSKSLNFLDDAEPESFVSVTAVTTAVNAICEPYKNVVSAFKSSSSSTIVKTIIKDGFSKFYGAGQTKVSKGVKEDKWDKYTANLLKNMHLPSNYTEAVGALLEEAAWTDENAWNGFDMLFNADSPSNDQVKFCCVCHGQSQRG